MFGLRKIVSGGQTGVDRAALDAALDIGLEHGGWCPLGRLAEDGFIPARYALRQTSSPLYAVRTQQNVLDSDATLILYYPPLSGGTELTARFCRQHCRPCWLLDLKAPPPLADLVAWLIAERVQVLNIAGPRESSHPGVGQGAAALLRSLFAEAKANAVTSSATAGPAATSTRPGP